MDEEKTASKDIWRISCLMCDRNFVRDENEFSKQKQRGGSSEATNPHHTTSDDENKTAIIATPTTMIVPPYNFIINSLCIYIF